MHFDKLDKIMRVFETTADQSVLPGIYMVARIDGRSFSRLTKEVCAFEAPYDERFRDMMVETVKHLMQCGFRVIYGYTQSDEISLLLHRDENSFNRKLRKYHSILAGEASAKFTSLLGMPAAFDCRICQLPDPERVVDYFRWRMADAHRNCLNSHCYWMLRKQGLNAAVAAKQLLGMSVEDKNELLFQNGINYNDLPTWQKRGIGFYWEVTPKEGCNPLTGQAVISKRQKIKVDYEIVGQYCFDRFLLDLINPQLFQRQQAILVDEQKAPYTCDQGNSRPARLVKIISGGQTGADRAGLDAALKVNIAIGGWCPAGRRAEDGVIPECYDLEETPSANYAVRTRHNVRDSDGTLIFNLGELDGGTKKTVEYAAKIGKPCLIVQLDNTKHPRPAAIKKWLQKHAICTLNVAGPRESKRPGIYRQSSALLGRLFRQCVIIQDEP